MRNSVWMAPALERLSDLWRWSLIGCALMAAGTVAGLYIGRNAAWPPVRAMDWWIGRVVIPLLRAGSWRHRALAIFTNNTVVLAVVLATGRWFPLSSAAALLLGCCLGVALTVLALHLDELPDIDVPGSGRPRWAARCGVALNMIELPAIALTLGLAIGYESAGMQATEAWALFGTVVVPMLAAAAAGEALWIDVGSQKHGQPKSDPTEPGKSGTRSPPTNNSSC